MLKKIVISNFKAIGDQPIVLDCLQKVNYLIGKNGSGKSSIVESLCAVASEIKPDDIAVGITPLKYEQIPYNQLNYDEFTFEREAKNVINYDELAVKTKISLELDSGEVSEFHQKSKIQNNELFYFIKVDIESESNESYKYNRINLLDNNPQSHLPIIKLFNKISKDFGIDDEIEFVEDKSLGFPFRFKKSGEKVQFELLSSGLKHLFQFYLSIYNENGLASIKDALQSNNIPQMIKRAHIMFLFEEVDRFLHPEAHKYLPEIFQKALEAALSSNPDYDKKLKERVQFLITTHSPFVINAALKKENQNVYHIKSGQCTNTHGYNLKTKKGYISEIHTNLGMLPQDLFFSNCLIWVEGPTDAIYLELWINKFTKGRLKKGIDYDFCLFGGASAQNFYILDDNYEFNPDSKDLAKIFDMLKIHPRSFIVFDNDKGDLKNGVKGISKFEDFKEMVISEFGDNYWYENDKSIYTIEKYARGFSTYESNVLNSDGSKVVHYRGDIKFTTSKKELALKYWRESQDRSFEEITQNNCKKMIKRISNFILQE